MFRTVKPLTTRVYTLMNATVVLSVLLAVFIAVNWARMPYGFGEFLAIRITVKNALVIALFFLACAVAFRSFGLSKPSPARPFWKELLQVTKACTVASVFALLFPLTTRTGAFTMTTVLYFLPAAIIACLAGRFVAHAFAEPFAGAFGGRHDLIIVGSGPRALAVYDRIKVVRRGDGCVLGFVDSPNAHPVAALIQQKMLGGLDDLEAILMKQPVDEVLIALPAKSCYEQIQTAIRTCERAGVEAKYRSDIFQLSLARPQFEADKATPVVSLKVVQDGYRLIVKRCLDIIGAIAGLVISGPLMLLIAAAIKITSPGPAIFTQERFGLNKRRFRMYKFRTMVANADKLQAILEHLNEAQGPVFKICKDPRITPVGRVLRKTSLDELPQLFNVLKGEMSLVGPRPLPVRDVERFDDASLMRRFSMKPGLTCLWQVSGRSATNFDHWIALDLQYIDQWSLKLDFNIVLRTLPAVLTGKGAV
jgi:exopolysaccharide biosynthesis polyprenyl glycosylphosphotransferase